MRRVVAASALLFAFATSAEARTHHHHYRHYSGHHYRHYARGYGDPGFAFGFGNSSFEHSGYERSGYEHSTYQQTSFGRARSGGGPQPGAGGTCAVRSGLILVPNTTSRDPGHTMAATPAVPRWARLSSGVITSGRSWVRRTANGSSRAETTAMRFEPGRDRLPAPLPSVTLTPRSSGPILTFASRCGRYFCKC